MQFKRLADLKSDLKKFTGFMMPDVISEPAQKSIIFLSDPNLCLPIEDSNSPIVIAFSTILNTKKLIKSWPSLIATMCQCLSSEAITGDALQMIVESMENASNEVDYDSGLRIIQFATSSVGNKFLEIPIFKTIFSLVLSFCSSTDKSLYTAALAAVRQILCSFIAFSISSSDSISPVTKKDINDCFSMTCETTITFDNPLNRIIYLILRDLSRMCNNENAVWIHNHNTPTSTAFAILEGIIKSHSDLLKSSPHFLQLIEVSMIAAEKGPAPLSFSVTVMDSFLESMPEQCANHFKFFLSKLDKRSSAWIRSLQFFRIFILKRSTIIFRFFKNCDPDAKLLSKLITKMLQFSDVLVNQENVEISLNSIGYDAPTSQFKFSAPIEIAVYFVQACLNSDPSIKKLVSVIWKDILVIISVSLTSVVDHSCYILMQNLHLLVELSFSLQLEEARGAVIAAFCNVLMSQHTEVRKNAFNTLTFAIQSTPLAFNGHWYKILSTLAEFPWEPTSLDFTKSLDINPLEEFSSALIAIHNSGKMARVWSLTLLSEVILTNLEHFNQLWPKISDKLLPFFGKDFSLDPAVSCLSTIVMKGFNEATEEMLCEFLKKIAVSCPQSHQRLLELFKSLLSSQGQIIQKGWNDVIEALSPKHFISDTNKETNDQKEDSSNIHNALITLGFQCVQVICTDLMFTLDESIQSLIISLLFQYASQKADNNVSLSSFNLLWNAIPLVKTAEMWKLIFGSCLALIEDPRNDVSLCAVKTFFSIILGNSTSLPSDILEYLTNVCFNQIIDFYVNSKTQNKQEATHQLCFQEIAHCTRSLWTRLSTDEKFPYNIWPKLIDQHLRFMKTCKKRDPLLAGFQFYEEAFQCYDFPRDLKLKLFDSLDELASFFLKKEPAVSSIFGSFGRFFLTTLPTQAGHIDDEVLMRWIALIKTLIIDIDSGSNIPPTTHKSLDGLLMVFPLDEKETEMVYQLLIDLCCNEKQNIRLIEVSLDHITDLCAMKENKTVLPKLFVMSSPIFRLKKAQHILQTFIDNDLEIDNDTIEGFANGLIELGKMNEDLSLSCGYAFLKLFLRCSDETKLKFIDSQMNCFEILEKLWSGFFDPNSTTFDEKSSMLCTKKVANFIGQSLPNCSDDNDLMNRLVYLRDVNSMPESICKRKEGVHRHINLLIPIFADLVLHPNEEIRKVLREIFLLLNDG